MLSLHMALGTALIFVTLFSANASPWGTILTDGLVIPDSNPQQISKSNQADIVSRLCTSFSTATYGTSGIRLKDLKEEEEHGRFAYAICSKHDDVTSMSLSNAYNMGDGTVKIIYTSVVIDLVPLEYSSNDCLTIKLIPRVDENTIMHFSATTKFLIRADVAVIHLLQLKLSFCSSKSGYTLRLQNPTMAKALDQLADSDYREDRKEMITDDISPILPSFTQNVELNFGDPPFNKPAEPTR